MKVCIAEKPSVAKEIAVILGAKSRKDGFFEGNGYAVTWTFGHFCELYNPDDYKESWKKWQLDSLPMLPEKFEIKIKKDKGVKKQFAILKTLFKKAELVINCGDAGQEGELIQRWVLQKAKYSGPVQRLWISSLTKEAITEGFNSLKPAKDFDRLYYAGSARAIGDWLLGMNGTRLFTLKYGGYKQVLSIGRVQTPTLAMVVHRQLEIDNFVSEPFWEMHTKYRDTDFAYVNGRFKKQTNGQELLEKVSSDDFTIISSEKKKGKEYAPKLFDLTSLQVHCNKRFGNTAEQTLKIVQKLYEMKLVTYPRVDTNYLPDDMYPKIKGTLEQLTKYNEFTAPLLAKKIPKSKRVFDNKKVTDHHAIIPTGAQSNLDTSLQRVYDSIVKRFLAAFYPHCEVSNTTVIGEAAEVRFKAKGKEILSPGWKVLYPRKAQDQKDNKEEKLMPNFVENETGPHEPALVEKNTQPPKLFTEATLLRGMESAGKQIDDEELRDLMKSNGIGRPSTRANIIETLFRRKYIQRQRKNIIATTTGIQLIQTIHNDLLKSPELTGMWEKQLRDIETGSYSPVKFINDMKEMVDKLVLEVRMQKAIFKISTPQKQATKSRTRRSAKGSTTKKAAADLQCPKCKKGTLLKGKSAYGCSTWKDGCDFRLVFQFQGKKFTQAQVKRLVTKGCTTSLKGFKVNGTKTEGLVRFDDHFQLILEQPKSKGSKKGNGVVICPKCKKGNLIRGKTAYGCSDWKNGCTFRFTFEKLKAEAKGKKLTKELALEILSQ